MRLSKITFWLSGIVLMFTILFLHRGFFLLSAKHTTGESIASHTYGSNRTGTTRTCHVRFTFEGRDYYFWTSQFGSSENYSNFPVIFNPHNPANAYEDSFAGIWFSGLFWIGIFFIPWSAAALSFVGSNERFVISCKKFGLVKIVSGKDD
ncbi:MAG: DUF3592 domain-containing protein [Bacteroidia bacterium]